MLEEDYANPSDDEIIRILHQRLDNAKIKIKDLENCNFSLLQEGRSFLTTMQELEELSRVQEETIKIQTKDKIYLRAKLAEWKSRAKELDDACCKITAKNIKLRKALKDCISDNCYYHEEECNMCTIGLLGQCKIPEAAKLLEECSINLSEKKEM